MIRQLRFMGIQKWKMVEVINALPLILHVSVAVFFVGIILFLNHLSPTLSWIVTAIAGVLFAFYLGSMILPTLDVQCPYRLPMLYRPLCCWKNALAPPLYYLCRPLTYLYLSDTLWR